MLDLLHHLPPDEVDPILHRAYGALASGGLLLIKDVDATPWPKVAFTWALDKLMDPRTPVNYLHRRDVRERLEALGFDVKCHQLVDYLPYPHVLYVCRKP